MKYMLYGNEFEVKTMEKPEGCFGSVFVCKGSNNLQEIGLAESFYYQAPNKFSIKSPDEESMWEADRGELIALAFYLRNSIAYGQLVSQFEEPHPSYLW